MSDQHLTESFIAWTIWFASLNEGKQVQALRLAILVTTHIISHIEVILNLFGDLHVTGAVINLLDFSLVISVLNQSGVHFGDRVSEVVAPKFLLQIDQTGLNQFFTCDCEARIVRLTGRIVNEEQVFDFWSWELLRVSYIVSGKHTRGAEHRPNRTSQSVVDACLSLVLNLNVLDQLTFVLIEHLADEVKFERVAIILGDCEADLFETSGLVPTKHECVLSVSHLDIARLLGD